MKKEQSYTNDYIVHHVDRWFKDRDMLSKKEYKMLKDLIWHMRDKK